MPLINDEEFDRPNNAFRPSPFNDLGSGMAWDPNHTGAEYAHSEVDVLVPEGFIAEGAVGADQIADGAVTPRTFDTTPPAVPTDLLLTTGTRDAGDGSQAPFLAAAWDPVADPDTAAYEIEVDRALTGDTAFTASASGTGGTLAAGTYRVKVTSEGVIGESGFAGEAAVVELAAGERLYVNVVGRDGVTGYRIYASRDADPKYAQTTTLPDTNVEVAAEGAGAVAPVTSSALTFINVTPYRTSAVLLNVDNVHGGVVYGVRVRAVDVTGNRSAWTAPESIVVAADSDAPTIPTSLVAVPGFRLVGLRWNPVEAADLNHYEVRWAPEGTLGQPDTGAWTTLMTYASALVVTGLDAEPHYFQVRAIDHSGNVRTSAVDETAVAAASNPEAGWTAAESALPTLVGAADVAFNSVLTDILASNTIDAGTIKTGTLSIGGMPNTPDFLLVYDSSGTEIGRWDEDGLVVTDPANAARRVRVRSGVIDFSSDGGATWNTAIGPEGVVADSIRLGTAPGGHNAIPNASFELTAFNSWLSTVWTSTADFDGYVAGSAINIDGVGNALVLVSAAF